MSPEVAEMFECARSGSQAEKFAALDFAKVFRHVAEVQEFIDDCIDSITHRCRAVRRVSQSPYPLQCDRREHEGSGNPWHVAFYNGYRYSWGPEFFERRPLLPDEEIP